MSIQEAIDIIGQAQGTHSLTLNQDFWDALNVALNALHHVKRLLKEGYKTQ